MIRLRLGFYVLYVVFGIVIVLRLLSAGPHWQTVSGMILGLALIALGIYRLRLYAGMRGTNRR